MKKKIEVVGIQTNGLRIESMNQILLSNVAEIIVIQTCSQKGIQVFFPEDKVVHVLAISFFSNFNSGVNFISTNSKQSKKLYQARFVIKQEYLCMTI